MSEFGESIRGWRKARGLSQLELGFQANVSSKHVSFLETGRSNPSREMVVQLSNALDIPLSERNVLLTVAGYAEAYSRMDINQPEMGSVREALSLMLNNHEPFPAIVLDWDWNIITSNDAHSRLVEALVPDPSSLPPTQNMMELLFDPKGFRPYIKNWEEVAYLLLQRLQRERMLYRDRQSDLLERLKQYPGVPDHWKGESSNPGEPMTYVILKQGDKRLKLFSTLTSFGTAIDITIQELVIEHYFPVDDDTREFFQQPSLGGF